METTSRFLVQIFTFGLCLFIQPSLSISADWYVEKDGNGDFSVIQDAVDAAESGDTIHVGPGQFSETFDFEFYYGQTVQTCVSLEKSLSFVGSGVTNTFIGPNFQTKNQFGTYGFASRFNGLTLEISDLTFANCDANAVLFDMEENGELNIDSVNVVNCWSGITYKGQVNGYVRNCNFTNLVSTGVSIILGGNNIEIVDCSFSGGNPTINIQFSDTGDISIRNCSFSGGGIGIALYDGGPYEVINCHFEGFSNRCIDIYNTTGVRVDGNVFLENSNANSGGIVIDGNQGLKIINNTIEGSFSCIGVLTPSPGMVFSGNHLIWDSDTYSIWTWTGYSGSPTHMDFTNNYWGTTDLSEISNSIWDGFDDDNITMFVVFDPIADAIVRTEILNWGAVKSLYR